MSLENHIKRLVAEHRKLDEQISTMENTGKFDDEELLTMKKHRLHLKDDIQRLRQLDPDHLPHKSDVKH
jgi:uncharacterized protein YdcH (DUF465 family)